MCYTWNPNNNQISYCSMPYLPTMAPYRGAASCTHVANAQYLGTAFSNPTVTFGVDGSNSGNQLLFTVSLQNCLDNSAASCQAGTDQANNPEIQVSGSAFPTQEGMQNN